MGLDEGVEPAVAPDPVAVAPSSVEGNKSGRRLGLPGRSYDGDVAVPDLLFDHARSRALGESGWHHGQGTAHVPKGSAAPARRG